MDNWTLAKKHEEALADARKRRRIRLYPPGILPVAAIAVVFHVVFGLEAETTVILTLAAAFLIFSVLYLVDRLYVGRKPFEEVVLPALVERLAKEKRTPVEHEHRPKKKYRGLNKTGGLFPRAASVSVKNALHTGNDSFFATTFVQSTGNASITHFKGVYVVLSIAHEERFQLREKGRPHLKGASYERKADIGDYRVYRESSREDSRIMEAYAQLLDELRADDSTTRVALSALPDALHIAIGKKSYRLGRLVAERIGEIYAAMQGILALAEDFRRARKKTQNDTDM